MTLPSSTFSVPTKLATKLRRRSVVDLERRADLLGLAAIHHRYAVGDRQRLFWSWVTKMVVMPSFFWIERISSRSDTRTFASRAEKAVRRAARASASARWHAPARCAAAGRRRVGKGNGRPICGKLDHVEHFATRRSASALFMPAISVRRRCSAPRSGSGKRRPGTPCRHFVVGLQPGVVLASHHDLCRRSAPQSGGPCAATVVLRSRMGPRKEDEFSGSTLRLKSAPTVVAPKDFAHAGWRGTVRPWL